MSGNDSTRDERIRDYLDGRLAGDDLDAFEMALFRDAALLDEVEAARVLRIGLAANAAPAESAPVESAPTPLRPRHAALRYLPLAASFALGAGLSGYLVSNRPPAPEASGKVQLLPVETVRGRPEAPTLALEAGAARVVLQFRAIATPGTADFAVELRRGDTLVQQVPGLVPNDDDEISIDVPAAKLDAGDYRAKIVARRGDGTTQDYAAVDFALKK